MRIKDLTSESLVVLNHGDNSMEFDFKNDFKKKDELNVWSSNTYLIMVTLQSFHESRLMLNFE